jgi:hypothetical protein
VGLWLDSDDEAFVVNRQEYWLIIYLIMPYIKKEVLFMIKKILDELQLKNFENLSENTNTTKIALGMNRDLDRLKINDDFSNENAIINENSPKKYNSYIKLDNNLENNK